MFEVRLNFPEMAAPAFKGLLQMGGYLEDCSVDKRFLELLFLRVSQLNGCTFCMDMHATALARAGEDPRRLHTLAGWRESPFFTEAEKAALNWAERLTGLGPKDAPDAEYERLANYFSEQEIVDLSFGISVINAWNRLGVGLRRPVQQGAADAA